MKRLAAIGLTLLLTASNAGAETVLGYISARFTKWEPLVRVVQTGRQSVGELQIPFNFAQQNHATITGQRPAIKPGVDIEAFYR